MRILDQEYAHIDSEYLCGVQILIQIWLGRHGLAMAAVQALLFALLHLCAHVCMCMHVRVYQFNFAATVCMYIHTQHVCSVLLCIIKQIATCIVRPHKAIDFIKWNYYWFSLVSNVWNRLLWWFGFICDDNGMIQLFRHLYYYM